MLFIISRCVQCALGGPEEGGGAELSGVQPESELRTYHSFLPCTYPSVSVKSISKGGVGGLVSRCWCPRIFSRLVRFAKPVSICPSNVNRAFCSLLSPGSWWITSWVTQPKMRRKGTNTWRRSGPDVMSSILPRPPRVLFAVYFSYVARYECLLYRHECVTGKYTVRKTRTKLHPGPEWHFSYPHLRGYRWRRFRFKTAENGERALVYIMKRNYTAAWRYECYFRVVKTMFCARF